MITHDIAYQVGDRTFTGYLADGSSGGPAPGVLVCHQGSGLTEHTRERARMLAELGYVAFALDLFGERATSLEHAMALARSLDLTAIRARAAAGLAQLAAQASVDRSRLAAIGHCMGGGVVLEMARCHPELACVVAFHPGLTTLPERDDRKVHARVMVCAGVQDPLIPAAARERFIALMTAADADWQLLTYGRAGHGFTDRAVDALGLAGFSYHAATDRRSWTAMRGLLDEALGRG